MRLTTRTGTAMLALVLAGGAATALSAQNYGLPLFTNPRISTGIRLHADFGRPGDAITLPDGSTADLTIFQAGLSFAIGPVGINAAVAANQADITACSNQSTQCDVNTTASAGVLAQIKAYGGGRRNVSVSLFGGASTDITAWDVATSGELPKQLNIPLGVAIGYRIPLGVASLNVWGAPRYSVQKFVNCSAGNQQVCDTSEGNFRWAVGADLPIFRVISVRAAYDSGKVGSGSNKQTVSFFGAGVSFGFGGMR